MRTSLMVLTALALATRSALSIGIYSAPTTCAGSHSEVNAGDTIALYVMAYAEPGWYDGFVGAEYRIVGLPSGWAAAATPSPASNITLGDPFVNGVDIGFPSGQSGCVLLHSIVITAATSVRDARLNVVAHATPSHPWGNPRDDCPFLLPTSRVDTDPPATCVEVIAHILNPTIGIQRSTWFELKGMYGKRPANKPLQTPGAAAGQR